MKKYLNIGLIALLAIAVIPLLLWMFGAFGPFQQSAQAFGGADILLGITYAYLIISAVVLIGMVIYNFGKGRGNSRIGLIVYGVMAVLAVILYFVGSANSLTGADGTVYDHVFTLKSTDMMLYLTYAALGVVVVILLWGEIRKAIK
jgi:hypothetical protein